MIVGLASMWNFGYAKNMHLKHLADLSERKGDVILMKPEELQPCSIKIPIYKLISSLK